MAKYILSILVLLLSWPVQAQDGETLNKIRADLVTKTISKSEKPVELLNVSYDPTREFYNEYNEVFKTYWKGKTGQDITIKQSHGGSGKQARAVIDGLKADVVTLALAYDIDEIAARGNGKLAKDWQAKLPHNSAPYTSTIVFLVRKGNPKNIKNWNDLIKDNVQVITPNPKTSGGARWNFLAAWAYAQKNFNNDEAKAKDFVTRLFKNVPILDSGARGSTITFVQRGMGDVLLAWENEAYLAINELGPDQFEIVMPSLSILAEPPVTVVEGNAKTHGAEEAAETYLQYLYSKQGQEIAAKNYYRPIDAEVLAANSSQFPKIDLVTINDFGGWAKAQETYFADDGIFDEIYKPGAE